MARTGYVVLAVIVVLVWAEWTRRRHLRRVNAAIWEDAERAERLASLRRLQEDLYQREARGRGRLT